MNYYAMPAGFTITQIDLKTGKAVSTTEVATLQYKVAQNKADFLLSKLSDKGYFKYGFYVSENIVFLTDKDFE